MNACLRDDWQNAAAASSNYVTPEPADAITTAESSQRFPHAARGSISPSDVHGRVVREILS